MNSSTTAILLSVGISLAILLLCCVAIFIVCYFSSCDDCCESKDDFGEQEITVEDVLLPRPNLEILKSYVKERRHRVQQENCSHKVYL
ncbi:hypothetical protein Ddc_18013 [Ditylenchus destructor]|nr:hypothetical protein Ddc_18013 [Ditylenchus destructor]